MAEGRPAFPEVQRAFTAHIRDPWRNPVPAGMDPARIGTYRELIFNNIESFIATGFPVLKSVLTAEAWFALVQDFFARHRSRTPLFVEIAEEFLSYLQTEREAAPGDPPYLLELAHYEWVELALAVAEAEPPVRHPLPGVAWREQEIVLSELAWPLAYRYPVHRIGPGSLPAALPVAPTCLLVYRDRDDRVQFLETNPVTHRWLVLLEQTGPCRADVTFRRLARELEHPDPDRLLDFGVSLLQDLAARGVVAVGEPDRAAG